MLIPLILNIVIVKNFLGKSLAVNACIVWFVYPYCMNGLWYKIQSYSNRESSATNNVLIYYY